MTFLTLEIISSFYRYQFKLDRLVSQLIANSQGYQRISAVPIFNLRPLFLERGRLTSSYAGLIFQSGQFTRIQKLQVPQILDISEKECYFFDISQSSELLLQMRTMGSTEMMSYLLLALITSRMISDPFFVKNWNSTEKKLANISITEVLGQKLSPFFSFLKLQIISFQHSQQASIFSDPISDSARGW